MTRVTVKKVGLVCLFLQFLFESVYCQAVIGLVVDADTKQPLSYVNIGIPGKKIGTASNADGNFKLTIAEASVSDSVKFSRIGYLPHTEGIKFFYRKIYPIVVYLKQTAHQLKEITITSYNSKEVIGNSRKSPWMEVGIEKDNLGSEIGTLIKLKHSPSYLRIAHFYISRNNNKKIELRLNLYRVSNGMPGESLLHEPIYVETTLQKGVWDVDLSKYKIEVTEDFVISLEYVKKIDFNGIYFHCIHGRNPSYARDMSQSNWKILSHSGRNLPLTITVETSY